MIEHHQREERERAAIDRDPPCLPARDRLRRDAEEHRDIDRSQIQGLSHPPEGLARGLARARERGGDRPFEAREIGPLERRRATRGQETIPLTSKEFALLELFLLRAPELVTRSEIVEHVWDCHFDSDTNLVEVYINRLRQKLDQNRPVKLIHTVRGVGYRLGMPES